MTNFREGHKTKKIPSFLEKTTDITKFDKEYTYDLVIAGAGTSGVVAALKAKDEGLKVAIVQKEEKASSCGHIGAGLRKDANEKSQVEALISHMMEVNAFRSKRERLDLWKNYSGEALEYLLQKSIDAKCQVKELGDGPHKALNKKLGLDISYITLLYGPKPYDTASALRQLCDKNEGDGLDIFYNTPAKEIIMEDNKVIGLACINKDGEKIAFYGKKGVILATGDYQNDKDMLDYYMPDVKNLDVKKKGRDGDGQKMIYWVGGKIENITHTKMVHDMDAGPGSMMDMPFMRVKKNGKRFTSENLGMEYMNCFLLSEEDRGHYMQIFDSAYMEKSKNFPGKASNLEELKKYMPDENVKDRTGVLTDRIDTHMADTLEELAEKLKIEDVEEFIKQVKRYNEFCDKGEDLEFGVDKKYLTKIDTPPYIGIHRQVRVTMAMGGVEVDGNLNCLREDGSKIEGLYAAGNLAGNFYGSVDYPLDIAGLNLGHNYTDGYFLGKMLSEK